MAEMPSYLQLRPSGELHWRAAETRQRLAACDFCPWACGVNRLQGEQGFCRAGALVRVANSNVHMWGKHPISGARGSGTIFFLHCTARCTFARTFPSANSDTATRRLPSGWGA